MKVCGYALFDTALGECAVAWSDRGIVAVQLPEASRDETRARLTRLHPDAIEQAPPADVARAVDGIRALLAGKARDLQEVTLDMDGVPAFHRRVYELARTIPCGGTLTYGAIASRLGQPDSARAVGQALGRNPFVIVVPCHRVLAAGGVLGGFSGPGGTATKRRLLEIEGAMAVQPTLTGLLNVTRS